MAFSLATNPAVREKAKAEIDANLGEGTPTFADVKKLPYTFAVLKESLRCADPSEPLKNLPGRGCQDFPAPASESPACTVATRREKCTSRQLSRYPFL